MKSMLWHKAKRFIQYLKLDFFVLAIYRFKSNTVQHIPLHFAKSFIPGKALSYNNLGHNSQFQLSIPLTLPASLGRNAIFQSQNRELSPLF